MQAATVAEGGFYVKRNNVFFERRGGALARAP
jgi:hypothetical protein